MHSQPGPEQKLQRRQRCRKTTGCIWSSAFNERERQGRNGDERATKGRTHLQRVQGRSLGVFAGEFMPAMQV